MDHQAVADFLLSHPHFFEEHAEILGTVKLMSPLLGRAVSLQERQMEIMRDRYRHLELRLSELLHVAHENENNLTRFQQWTQALLLADKDTSFPAYLVNELKKCFDLPHVALKLWGLVEAYQQADFATDISEETKRYIDQLHVPYCGKKEAVTHFLDQDERALAEGGQGTVAKIHAIQDTSAHIKPSFNQTTRLSQIANWLEAPFSSLAIVPLKQSDRVIGVLVLGAEDEMRYTEDMATQFLEHIGDTTTAALHYLFAPAT